LAVSLFVVLSVAGLTLVQRLVSPGLRQEHNDVAGFIYAVLGVAYAVLLAFVVIAVWEQYQAARDTTDREANELAEIYWLAYQLPESEGRQVQELAQSYARVVVEEEWPLMEDGQFSPQAWALVDEIRQRIGQFESSTSNEQVLQDQGLTRVHDLADARRLRLLETHEDIPTILWVVLLSGGVITTSGDADSRKFKRLKTPQVACARELEPAPLDTQALPVWRYVLILHCGEGGAQNAL
jgi:Protein of unknown function (DUF4239)